MDYTNEQYQRVLSKSADMKEAIDVIRYMSKNGIDSWTDFGKALDELYRARDAYINEQHKIILENCTKDYSNSKQED